MTEVGEATTREVARVLHEVVDPCSCFTSTPIDIVDLGLVTGISIDRERIRVDLTLTEPMCMFFIDIVSEIEDRLGRRWPAARADVVVDDEVRWDPAWSVRRSRVDIRPHGGPTGGKSTSPT